MQHVVFRLADSFPAAALDAMKPLDKVQRFARCDRLLDADAGSAMLRTPAMAQIVAGALRKFDGERYALIAWCTW